MIEIKSARWNQVTAHQKLGDVLSFEINPNEICKTILKEFRVGNDLLQNKAFFKWFVVGGNWDEHYEQFRNERNYSEIIDLIQFGDNFRNSPSYLRCIQELQKGVPQKGFDGLPFSTIEDIDGTFNYYLNLIASMKLNGYISQSNLPNSKQDKDIGVAISTTSELFHFRTGHHRLAIAQLLKLPRVKVSVQFIHPNWLQNMASMNTKNPKSGILEIIREKIKEIDETAPSKQNLFRQSCYEL